tara:strand:- start:70 stop:306 length:237 start_codon:yes stop_codon:yes gene_type:complete
MEHIKMKLSIKTLKKLIKEELEKLINTSISERKGKKRKHKKKSFKKKPKYWYIGGYGINHNDDINDFGIDAGGNGGGE